MGHNPDSSNNKGDINNKGDQKRTGGLERRDFLKFSATGVIASLAAGCAVRTVTPDSASSAAGATADASPPEPPPRLPRAAWARSCDRIVPNTTRVADC